MEAVVTHQLQVLQTLLEVEVEQVTLMVEAAREVCGTLLEALILI